MNSRETILSAVDKNQPDLLPLPDISHLMVSENEDNVAEFKRMAESIGARVVELADESDIINEIKKEFNIGKDRIVTTLNGLETIAESFAPTDNHHWADVELMILPAHFGVAENGASYVNDGLFEERVLPFIPQHLILVLKKENIVPTMHHAYQLIGDKKYGFATFIAGPSKTADIEQSLVLGAHGPRSLRVFLI